MKKRLGFLLACILAVGLLVIPAHAANTVSSELTVTLDEATGKPLLTWTSASQYELSFYLYRSTSGGSTNGIINKPFTEVEANDKATYTYLDTEAVPTYTYYYKVKPVLSAVGDALGLVAGLSNEDSVTCACPPPVVTVSYNTSGKPVLAWEAVEGAANYRVLVYTETGTDPIATSTVTALSYTHSAATAGTTYRYEVSARYLGDTVGTTGEAVTAKCRLAAPTVTLSYDADSGKPKLSWSVVTGANQYNVTYSTSENGSWLLLNTTSNRSYVHEDAEAGVKYYYRVNARNDSAVGVAAETSATCKLPKPTSLTASVNEVTGKPVLTWAAVPGAEKYSVYRSLTENGSYSLLTVTAETSYTNTDSMPGNTYYYKIAASITDNAGSLSAQSNAVSAVCTCAQPVVTGAADPETGKPVLTWTKLNGADTYEISRVNIFTGDLSNTTTVSGTTYTDTAAEAGIQYTYIVTALHSEKEAARGTASERVSVRCICAQPILTATLNDKYVQLSWNTIEGADSYEVYRSKDGVDYELIAAPVVASHVDINTEAGYTYSYKVKAIHDNVYKDANSIDSESVNCTVPGIPPYVLADPQNVTAQSGERVTFSVTAIGDRLTYQWQYQKPGSENWYNSSASSATTAELSVTASAKYDGYAYRCVVSGCGDPVESKAGVLTVLSLSITGQPEDVTATAGQKVTFSVTAEGDDLTYQWQYQKPGSETWSNSSAGSAATNELSVTANAKYSGYSYRCVVTSGSVSVESDPAVLTVTVPALSVTAQPEDTAVKSGNKAVFSVTAEGTDLTYQWQYRKSSSDSWKSTTFSGAKTATLTVSAKTTHDGYQYRCAVTGNGTTVYSEPASLSVVGIKKAPVDATVGVGEKAKFTVQATGSNISYQWQYRKSAEDIWKSTTFSGNKTATLTVTAKAYHDGYQYRCKVTDGTNSAWSAAATLTVNSFAITAQPDDTAVKVGGKAVFAVETTGEDLTYQWQYRKSSSDSWKSTTFSGAKTDTLTVTAKAYHDGYQYRCKISDGTDTVYSEAAELSVLAITAQPEDVTAEYGSKVTFEVEAQGDGLTYQWRYRTSESGSWANSTVTSAKTAALSVTAYNKYDGYQYRCTVKDAHGNTVYSSIVTLTVS